MKINLKQTNILQNEKKNIHYKYNDQIHTLDQTKYNLYYIHTQI